MAEVEEQQKRKFDLKKVLTIALIAFNFLVVGTGAYLAYAGTLGHKTPVAMEEDLNRELVKFRKVLDEPPVLYSMEVFNTNLEGLPRRFVRMEMSVEMYDKEGFEELVMLGGESRDAIIRILNGKRYNEIETVQGKLHLKNEIVAHLNDSLKRGVVKNIYFTKFQVQ